MARFYHLVHLVVDVLLLRGRSDRSKDIEILVLRHQLSVLPRPAARPRFDHTDRVFLAALSGIGRDDRRRATEFRGSDACVGW